MAILTPLSKILQANTKLLLDSRAGLAALHEMELVAVVNHAGLDGLWCLDSV